MNDSPAAKPMPPKKKVSTATKVVIFLVSSAVVLLGVLALDIYLIADKFGNQVTDPAKIRNVAATMVELDPLPERFRYLMCLDVGDLKTVAIEDAQTGVNYTLIARNHKFAKLTDEELLEAYVQHRETFGLEKTGLMKGFTPNKRGHITIAGQPMPYAIGHSQMSKFKVTQLIGVVTPPSNKGSFIAFLAQTPSNQPLNVEDVEEFLKYIKRLK
jgi:hypothetical protein